MQNQAAVQAAPTNNDELTDEQRQYLFQQRRCAVITSIWVVGLGVVVLAAALAYPQLMYADTETVSGFKYSAGFGFFKGEACLVGNRCAEVPTSDLNCGSDDQLNGAKVLVILAMVFLAIVFGVNLFELCTHDEPLRFTTVIFSSLAIGAMVLAHILLFIVRSKAKYDAQTCPKTIPGLLAYAISTSWILIGVVTVAVITSLSMYMSRRHGLCMCCCAPDPVDQTVYATQAVVAIPVNSQPMQQYPPQQQQQQQQAWGAAPPPQQQVYPPYPGQQQQQPPPQQQNPYGTAAYTTNPPPAGTNATPMYQPYGAAQPPLQQQQQHPASYPSSKPVWEGHEHPNAV